MPHARLARRAMTQDELKSNGRAARRCRYVTGCRAAGRRPGDRRRHRLDGQPLHRRAGRHARPHRRRGLEQRTQQRAAAAHGIRVLDSNEVERLPLYVDGADEIDASGYMIKGGGAALTREKIVADLADRFVCIADESKQVAMLGRFSAAGRGDPDGVRAGDAALRGARRPSRCCARASSPTTAARSSTSAGSAIDRSGRDGARDQPVARCRHGRHLRAPQGQRLPARARPTACRR